MAPCANLPGSYQDGMTIPMAEPQTEKSKSANANEMKLDARRFVASEPGAWELEVRASAAFLHQ